MVREILDGGSRPVTIFDVLFADMQDRGLGVSAARTRALLAGIGR